MNSPIPVNVLDVALRVMSAPAQPVSVSMVEAYALCLFVLQQNDLPAPAEDPTFLPVEHFPASLAAKVLFAIRDFDALIAARATRDASERSLSETAVELREAEWAAWDAFEIAFNTLKTRFEKEFPNV